jgi:NADH-quinone oxidoreductase subunit E
MPTRTRSLLRKYIRQPDPLVDPPSPELQTILDRYRGQPDGLISVLEEIQAHYGYLPKRDLLYTARDLRFPLAQVYGVATFYNLFQLNPPGRYCVRVCTGTACHVNRSSEILLHLKEQLGIGEDETTSDGLFTLQTVACMGACSLAPVVAINEQVHGRMTPDRATQELEQVRDAEVPV